MLDHQSVARAAADFMQNIRAARQMHPRSLLARVALLFLVSVSFNFAQGGSRDVFWNPRSPAGADIGDLIRSPLDSESWLAAHSDRLHPGNGGLYRSSDGGKNWQADAVFGARSVNALAFSASGEAFVGTSQGLMTADAKFTRWIARDLGIGSNQNVLALATGRSQPDEIWVGLSGGAGLSSSTLMRSSDRGLSWQDRAPPSASSMQVRAIALDERHPRRIAIACSGTFGGGALWISEDSGSHWTLRSNSLPNQPMLSVAFVGTRLLVGGGSRLAQQDFGLYASDDLGLSWYPLHRNDWPSRVVTDIALAPDSDNTIWIATDGGGVSRSVDGGVHWEHALGNTMSVSAQRIRFHHDKSVAVAVLGEGVLQASDANADFRQTAAGMHARVVRAVAIDPGDDRHIAVSLESLNTGSVYQSFDAGLSWQQERLPPTRFNSLQFDRLGRLFAVSGGPTTVAPEGLYRREPDGSWRALGPDQGPQYETDIQTLRVGRRHPSRLLMAGADRGTAGTEGTIWLSQDAGEHWQRSHESMVPGAFTDIEWMGELDQAALASFDDASGARAGTVLRTEDGGIHWSRSDAGLPTILSQPRLCVSESDPGRTYLIGHDAQWRGALYRSDDAGRSWIFISSGTSIQDIACDPEHADTIYLARASTTPGVSIVQRSDDGGRSFVADDAGLVSAGRISALAINLEPVTGSTLMAATRRGVFRRETRTQP